MTSNNLILLLYLSISIVIFCLTIPLYAFPSPASFLARRIKDTSTSLHATPPLSIFKKLKVSLIKSQVGSDYDAVAVKADFDEISG